MLDIDDFVDDRPKRPTLFIGGPWDGRRMVVRDRAQEILAPLYEQVSAEKYMCTHFEHITKLDTFKYVPFRGCRDASVYFPQEWLEEKYYEHRIMRVLINGYASDGEVR